MTDKRTAVPKALAATAAVLLALALPSCGKPADMDQTTYDLGQQAASVGDSYLDGSMGAGTARDMLHGISGEISDYEAENEVSHLLVGSDVMAMENDLSPFSAAGEDEFAEDLEKLKKDLR